MTNRDELTRLIAEVFVSTNPNQVQEFDDLTAHGQRRWLSRASQVTEAIIAAGWRKQNPGEPTTDNDTTENEK